jgi:2-(1,2-epoxy-1,2-dihydrophenyl)acetyl-CoA isomerase
VTDEYASRWGEGPVLAVIDEGVLTVTLNRPEIKNAMNMASWERLFDILRVAEHDDAVRVLVLTGAGGTFCSGADISTPAQGHPLSRVTHISRTAAALYSFSKPTIALVEGAAVGAGWNLALCCDLVAASSDARFAQIFVHRGLTVDFGGSWLLPHLVGIQQAKRLALLGEFVSSQEALGLGLVTWVKDPGELGGFVASVARRLAAGPPVALAQNKSLINEGCLASFDVALTSEARAQAVNYATADAAAARQAFLDKATPEFTGEWRHA